jgi:hypothetical protein
MIAQIAAVIAVSFISLWLGANIATVLGQTNFRIIPFQMAVAGILGYIVGLIISSATTIAVVALIVPVTINGLAIVYKHWQDRRALNGAYGKPTQWATELVKDGDTEFAHAIKILSRDELVEIGVVAEDKEHLRELTMERIDEKFDGELPDTFLR